MQEIFKKKRKEELKLLYKQKPYLKEEYDWTYVGVAGIIAGCFLILLLLGIVSNKFFEEDKNNCEKLDETYEVVDRKWNGKQYVNMYGCVK